MKTDNRPNLNMRGETLHQVLEVDPKLRKSKEGETQDLVEKVTSKPGRRRCRTNHYREGETPRKARPVDPKLDQSTEGETASPPEEDTPRTRQEQRKAGPNPLNKGETHHQTLTINPKHNS
jgi:hypothetical protein